MRKFSVAEVGLKNSGIATVSVLGDNLEVLDSKHNSIAKISTSRTGKQASLTINGSDGHVSDISFNVTADKDETLTVTGTYNQSPFHESIDANGVVSNVLRPANLNANDIKVASALFHLKLPTPQMPQSGGKSGHAPRPMISVGCGLAILGGAAAGWELGPLSGSIAIHTIIWECFIAD